MTAYPEPANERSLTAEEFARLPSGDDRSELVRGRIVREPPAGFEHGGLAMEVGRRIAGHVRRHGLGRVFAAETGFVLREGPATVRAPDVAFVASDRLPDEPVTGFAPLPPDLAVEVASPSESASGLQGKVLDYLDAGSRLVWVVDPRTRTVTTYRSRDEIRVLDGDDLLEGGDVLPGFRVRIAKLFED